MAAGPRKAVCSGCGAPMIWATVPGHDRPVPIDAKRVTVYESTDDGKTWAEAGLAFVNHFRTCPKRERFYGDRPA